jgi:hypothetical protein
MSARVLAILILPTMLLAVSLTPSRAAQQPTEPAKAAKHGRVGKAKMVQKVYQVTDLVTPLTPTTNSSGGIVYSTAPWGGKWSSGEWLIFGSLQAPPPQSASGESDPHKCSMNATDSDEPAEALLQRTIKNSIAPQIWHDAGGPASMVYFPLTHSLVVTAPVDIHERIADLLSAKRRLQDQEVACELRFVHVSEDAYGHIRKEFELKDAEDGPLATLDDKGVCQLLEAVQSDRHASVMQAPKITLFNGQAAGFRIGEERPFLTGATVDWNGEKFVVQPKTETIFSGMNASLGTVLSADLRFVRMYVSVAETDIDAKEVAVGPAILSLPRCPANASTPPVMQAIEMPKVKTKHSVEKKLVLPEGKTAVLFGWKQTTEITDAVPVLSKLRYIGKHYQRVRQEPETVLVLVTPRVVVPEKTEEVLPTRALETVPVVQRAPSAEEQEATPNVDDLLANYHAACTAGKLDKARKIAVKALKIDPTCFDRKR